MLNHNKGFPPYQTLTEKEKLYQIVDIVWQCNGFPVITLVGTEGCQENQAQDTTQKVQVKSYFELSGEKENGVNREG